MKRFKVTRKGPASYDKNDIRLKAHTIQEQACTTRANNFGTKATKRRFNKGV